MSQTGAQKDGKAVIYKGFARGLKKLNATLASPLMVKTPLGRAYAKGNSFYADQIHLRSIAEAEIPHLCLAKEFNRKPQEFAGRVYMGAAGFLNLSFIAAARPAAAILFDVNAAQTVFWNDVIKALADNPGVEGFIDFLEDERKNLPRRLQRSFRQAVDRSFQFPLCCTSSFEVYREVSNVREWIRLTLDSVPSDKYWMKPDKYKRLHLLAKSGALGALTLDVTDRKAFLQLKDFLNDVEYTPVAAADAARRTRGVKKKGARVGLLYISNIFNFLEGKKDWSRRRLRGATPYRARRNLETVLSKKCAIIDYCPQGKLTWPVNALRP